MIRWSAADAAIAENMQRLKSRKKDRIRISTGIAFCFYVKKQFYGQADDARDSRAGNCTLLHLNGYEGQPRYTFDSRGSWGPA
jgi:pyruvate-formate lyase